VCVCVRVCEAAWGRGQVGRALGRPLLVGCSTLCAADLFRIDLSTLASPRAYDPHSVGEQSRYPMAAAAAGTPCHWEELDPQYRVWRRLSALVAGQPGWERWWHRIKTQRGGRKLLATLRLLEQLDEAGWEALEAAKESERASRRHRAKKGGASTPVSLATQFLQGSEQPDDGDDDED